MQKVKKVNKITKIEEGYYSKFLKIFEVNYKTIQGNEKKWRVASRKTLENYKKMIFKKEEFENDAVLIAAIDANKKALVLIREFRIPINDYIYSLPAGLIGPGEDMYESAAREMYEETGLDLYEIDRKNSCKKSFASAGMSDESLAIVYGKVRGKFSSKAQEESEIIEPIYVDQKKAKEILESNENIDIKAWLLLKNFARIGEL